MKTTKKAANYNLKKSTIVRLNSKPKNEVGLRETGLETATTTSLITISHLA